MKKFSLFLIITALLLLSSCTDKVYEKEFFAMDTVMTVKQYGNNNFSEINNCIFHLNTILDRKNPNSEIGKINSNTKTSVSDDTLKILSYADKYKNLSSSAFNINIAPVMDIWGFYEKDYRIPTHDEILSALSSKADIEIDEKNVYLKSGSIDLGGIAKGYLSDRLAEIIRSSGTKSAIMSLGGNVYCIGTKPNGDLWHVGIKNPKKTNETICSVTVCDTAVVTSGIYQRGFTKDNKYYHHIIDPKTGYPVDNNLASVTVISKSGTEADALSTALFVLGIENSMKIKNDDFEAIFITKNNEIYITDGIKDNFNTENKYEILK